MFSPHSSRPLLAFISGHGSSLDCRKEGLAVMRQDQTPWISFPSQGSCRCQGAAPPSSDSPCSSPLSPLHASRLACVHLCGEECKTALLTTSPCCSATSTGALPPAQPSTLPSEMAAYQREVTRLLNPLVPGPEQLTLPGQGKEGTNE